MLIVREGEILPDNFFNGENIFITHGIPPDSPEEEFYVSECIKKRESGAHMGWVMTGKPQGSLPESDYYCNRKSINSIITIFS
jgi:hypothetical protein